MASPPAAPGPTLPRRLPGIDVLRAIAALAVAVAHVVQTVLPAEWARHGTSWSTLGGWGVGLFFVISGFCIHAPLVRRELSGEDARIDYRAFYKRRFLRLYPAHLAALLLSIAAAALFAGPPGGAELVTVTTPRQLVLHLFMAHTFSKTALYSGNAVLWTLAIETHFYLAYPLFLGLRARFGTGRVLLALFAFSAAATLLGRATGLDLGLLVVSALYRWWEWILGCLVVEQVLSKRPVLGPGHLAVIGLALASLLAGVLLPHVRGGSMSRALWWPLLFAVVVVAASWMRPAPASLLTRGLMTVGLASYSLYLIHPVAYHVAASLLVRAGASTALVVVGTALAGAALTVVFFVLVERPLMNRALGRAAPAPATSS